MNTKTARFTLLGAAALSLAGLAVQAQTADPVIDTDGDGMYSFPELQVAMPEMTGDEFTALDTTGDGLLDGDEIAAAVEAGTLPPTNG